MEKLEKKILRFLGERGWDGLRPSDIAKSIAIEAAELLEIFQWDNSSLAWVRKDKERVARIQKELADVMIYCLELAVLLEISSRKAILEKIAHNAKKYPAKAMRRHAKKSAGSGGDSAYWKIKKEWRMKGES